jgi:hypothetical protein
MLFKHYESLISYNEAFKELIGKAQEYRKQEEYESHWLIKANELKSIQKELDMIHYKG